MGSSTKQILVVDDEPKIVDVVRSYLENRAFLVQVAYTGKHTLELFERASFALVILDLMLPDLSGEEICQTLRQKSNVPIIMLTAKIEEESVLRGLDIGADDYVTKPFSPRQLLARVKALLRRTEELPASQENEISINDNDLVINYENHEVKKQGNILNLTPNEFKLLTTLLKYPKKVFTREELITLVIGEDFGGYDRIIDTHIKNLRQKIETDAKNPFYILTVHGIGYRFGGD